MEDYNFNLNLIKEKLDNKTIVVTGGAGFIGSNIVKFLTHCNLKEIRIIDNFSTGYHHNISQFLSNQNVTLEEGDIRNLEFCIDTVKGADLIFHQAALGSVPRSIEDPITSHNVNVNGTLNIFRSAHLNNIDRVIYASSSSVYGSSKTLPKVEKNIGKALSPYSLTKLINEEYGSIFAKHFKLNTVGLRYFNVFGPNQDPSGSYAAVIPLFIDAILNDRQPIINGDGSYTRDFTFIENVVYANLLAAIVDIETPFNEVFNIACGKRYSLLDLVNNINQISGKDISPVFGQNRKGDIPHSLADISLVREKLGYEVVCDFENGLQQTIDWFKSNSGKYYS